MNSTSWLSFEKLTNYSIVYFLFLEKVVTELNAVWQVQARRIAKEIFMGHYPERFLATDFADEVQWLDFV